MLATPITIREASNNGPRPINLSTDVRQIMTLLNLAFGPLRDNQGRRIVNESVSLGFGTPFNLRWRVFSGGFIPGFVWEESGRIVGNISLIETEIRGRILIANVAVHPDYRNRGIATTLLNIAIEHVQNQKANEFLLQVDSDNENAINLYKRFGFFIIGTMAHWEAASSRIRIPAVDSTAIDAVRPLKKQEWQKAFELDKLSLPVNLNWPAPPPKNKYQWGLWRSFNRFINGQKAETWVVDDQAIKRSKTKLVGLAHIYRDWARPINVDIRVDPLWQRKIERPLLAKSLGRIKKMHKGKVFLRHPADDEVTNNFLEESNFRASRKLSVMHLDLQTIN